MKRRRLLLWCLLSFLLCLTVALSVILFLRFRPAETTVFSPDAKPLDATEKDSREMTLELDPQFSDSQNWPGWRGYNGQGIATHNTVPLEFGRDTSAGWSVVVPGKGYSSPIVWLNQVFVTTEVEKNLMILCYSIKDGEMLWKVDVGTAIGPTHNHNGHASSTPVTDGERLFSFFGATGLFCHDLDGNELWQADLGPLQQMHGLGSSPILYKDYVIQLCDNVKDSYIAAFNKLTGEEVWRTARSSGGGWTTPILAKVKKSQAQSGDDNESNSKSNPERHFEFQDQLIVNGGCASYFSRGQIVAYDPNTGKEIWNCAGPVGWGIPTPVLNAEEDTVYVLCGERGAVTAIDLRGTGDVSATHKLWERTRTSPYVPSGVFYRNRLYIPSDRNKIICLNPGNGEVVFEQDVLDSFYSSLVAVDGRLYATTMQGISYVFDLENQGKILWRTDLNEICYASPAVANNRLFLRTATTLFCFENEKKNEKE